MSWGEKVKPQACRFHFEKCNIERKPVDKFLYGCAALNKQGRALETLGLVTLMKTLMKVFLCLGDKSHNLAYSEQTTLEN